MSSEVTGLKIIGQITVIGSRSLGLVLCVWKIICMFYKVKKLEEKYSVCTDSFSLI